MVRFTEEMLAELQTRYNPIERIDPEGAAYKSLVKLLDQCSVQQLEQLRDAKIKFVSNLAINRLIRRER